MLYPGSPIKSLIIEYLAENHFAQAKEIIAAVQTLYDKKRSFQSIYKNLNALIKEGILVKHSSNYTFNLSYLQSLQKLSNVVTGNVAMLHDMNNLYQTIEYKKKVQIPFKSLSEIHVLARNIFLSWLYKEKKSDDKKLYMNLYHNSTFFLPKENNFCQKMSECKKDIYVYGDAETDKKAYHAAKNTQWAFTPVKENQFSKNYQECAIYGENVCIIDFSDQGMKVFSDFLYEHPDHDVQSPEFMQFFKYHYCPGIITIEKNTQKAAELITQVKSL
jgi:Fe2+ or Zn2+ uptake regulation protein